MDPKQKIQIPVNLYIKHRERGPAGVVLRDGKVIVWQKVFDSFTGETAGTIENEVSLEAVDNDIKNFLELIDNLRAVRADIEAAK